MLLPAIRSMSFTKGVLQKMETAVGWLWKVPLVMLSKMLAAQVREDTLD